MMTTLFIVLFVFAYLAGMFPAIILATFYDPYRISIAQILGIIFWPITGIVLLLWFLLDLARGKI